MLRKLCFSLPICLLAAGLVVADVVHDESVDGELSDDGANPTFLTFSVGANEVIGSTTNSPLDRDLWTFIIGADQQLDSVFLRNYDTTEDASFFAVESGNQITSFGSAAGLLGSTLVGSAPGAQQGDDVLDDLGGALFGGAGFSGPLGPGQYTFWFQETAANTNYNFEFNVSAVPEPGSFAVLALGLPWMLRRRR